MKFKNHNQFSNNSCNRSASYKKAKQRKIPLSASYSSHFKTTHEDCSFYVWRFRLILILLSIIFILLITRLVYLNIIDRNFLSKQGNARSMRIINIPAYRGMILDRNDEPLAVSTPVDSVWINPQDFPNTTQNKREISQLLHISPYRIKKLLRKNAKREFVYIKRSINPATATSIKQLSIPGVYLEQGYKRYYPESESAAHVVGFTNIDDKGQEGLELAYNNWLSGKPGKQRVLKDRFGHIVAIMADIHPAKSGHDLTLSIDNRIQFLAYQALKETVQQYKADSGSVVILDPRKGEILAMVNQPSFNPNKRPNHDYGQFRNRAITDIFEPGSTMKAFSIASALDSGKYTPDTIIDTNPGWFMVGHNKVQDENLNHGKITVTQVLQKSSNVGVAKMTLSLPPDHFIDLLQRIGFSERTRSGFPGESAGILKEQSVEHPFNLATLAFGYGISVTPLQLAQAYGIISNDGLKCPITFLKQDDNPSCTSVMKTKVAHEMLDMLESVVQDGTGTRAKVAGYRIAGKTGTAHIASIHGYNKNSDMASFVGIAPASNPKLVVAVVIRNPKSDYYGAIVAAPTFAKIMGGALRILDIAPDA